MDRSPFVLRSPDPDFAESRRAFLVRALSAGAFAIGTLAVTGGCASRPGPLPPGRSVHRVSGEVRVDGRTASETTTVRADSVIETGDGSEFIFVVGRDAFILREASRVELSPTPFAGGGGGAEEAQGGGLAGFLIGTLRVVSGSILSVFGERGPDQGLGMSTSIATIGIRGTGIYVEAEPERTYVCTCYGRTIMQAIGDPASSQAVETRHHESPRYILAEGPSGRRIHAAPVLDHSDMELRLIEALVGRKPPFFPGDQVEY